MASLREDAGLARAAVARAAHVAPATVGRIEDAAVDPGLETLVRVAAVLGCEVSLRLYPAGRPLRDRFQAPMLEALLQASDPAWERRLEVPVVGTVRGVIDLVLLHPSRRLLIAVEVHSEVRRVEEVLRRSADKAAALRSRPPALAGADPDAEIIDASVSRLLLLRSTRATRATVQDLALTFAAAYPARTADAVTALRDAGVPWPGSAIVWVDLHGRRVHVMGGPPRNVTVGR